MGLSYLLMIVLQVKSFPIKNIGTSCFLLSAACIAFFLLHSGKEIL